MNAPPVRTYVVTWLALLALLAATFGLAQVEIGAWNATLSFAIAAVKALLVALFFMHLRRAPALLAIFAAIGLVWMALLFGLSATDYATREVSPAAYAKPPRPF